MLAYIATQKDHIYKEKKYSLKCEIGKTYMIKENNIFFTDTFLVFDNLIILALSHNINRDIIYEIETKSINYNYQLGFTNEFKILRILPKEEYEKVSKGKIKLNKNKKVCFIDFQKDSRDIAHSQKFFYKNNKLCKSIDSDGNIQKYTYCNNKIVLTQNEDYWETRRYDDNGNLILKEDSQHQWWKYQYDKQNNLIMEDCSYNNTWKKYYYENNQLIFEVNSSGERICYQYDSNNNLIRKDINNINENIEYYEYDKNGNRISYRNKFEEYHIVII